MKEKHSIWHKNLKSEEQHGISWKPKSKVWFQKNDDGNLGKHYMVYNNEEEIHIHGKENAKRLKQSMKQSGKKNVGYTEWGDD